MKNFNNVSICIVVSLVLLIGCKSREERIQAAVEAGNKSVAHEQERAAQEIGKAKAHELDVTTTAASRVAEAQRQVDNKQVESVQTAAVADGMVMQQELEATERITKANHEAQRQMEEATKPLFIFAVSFFKN